MQPYFLPYIGYYQLIGAADVFVIYDNIKYTKRGWINRNRLLANGKASLFTLPLRKASDSLDVGHRELASDFSSRKLLRQFRAAYARAPQFATVAPVLEGILNYPERNLFTFIHHSVTELCSWLGIATEIRRASEVPIDHTLRGEQKVIALCHALGADTYINPIGGLELYRPRVFAAHNIELRFIATQPFEYRQFGVAFVPWLSIIDVLMFNPLNDVRERVGSGYELIEGEWSR